MPGAFPLFKPKTAVCSSSAVRTSSRALLAWTWGRPSKNGRSLSEISLSFFCTAPYRNLLHTCIFHQKRHSCSGVSAQRMEDHPLTIPALKAEEIMWRGVHVHCIHKTGPDLFLDAQQTAPSCLFCCECLNMASISCGLCKRLQIHYLNLQFSHWPGSVPANIESCCTVHCTVDIVVWSGTCSHPTTVVRRYNPPYSSCTQPKKNKSLYKNPIS